MKAWRTGLVVMALIWVMLACSLPDDTSPPITPTGAVKAVTLPVRDLTRTNTPMLGVTPSYTPARVVERRNVISVSLRIMEAVKAVPEVEAGKQVTLGLTFEPLQQEITRTTDGRPYSTSSQLWKDPPVSQLRYCIGQGQPCTELGTLQPFQGQLSRQLTVDWLGLRRFYLLVEFLDVAGKPLPAVWRSADTNPPVERLEVGLDVLAQLNPAVPLETLPAAVRTSAAATRTAFPVTGSVLIENGRCCAGGPAGSKVKLNVEFKAASSAGKVTDMSTQYGCVKDATQMKGEWEPFQPSKTYEAGLALNWVGWYIAVQYRDDQGSLSPVYCDDISLEGSPPQPPTTRP